MVASNLEATNHETRRQNSSLRTPYDSRRHDPPFSGDRTSTLYHVALFICSKQNDTFCKKKIENLTTSDSLSLCTSAANKFPNWNLDCLRTWNSSLLLCPVSTPPSTILSGCVYGTVSYEVWDDLTEGYWWYPQNLADLFSDFGWLGGGFLLRW